MGTTEQSFDARSPGLYRPGILHIQVGLGSHSPPVEILPDILLSVCICTLQGREGPLGRLLAQIQDKAYPQLIQVMVAKDNGELTIGRKRNLLKNLACGQYTVFIDDDDSISPDYFDRILPELAKGPDAVGISGIITRNHANPIEFRNWHENATWRTVEEDGKRVYLRTINHICPVRTSLYREIDFPETSFGEDHAWANLLAPRIKTTSKITAPVYFYNFKTTKEPNHQNYKSRPRLGREQ